MQYTLNLSAGVSKFKTRAPMAVLFMTCMQRLMIRDAVEKAYELMPVDDNAGVVFGERVSAKGH